MLHEVLLSIYALLRGAIGKLQEASPWMALASLIIIYSLRAVCRIGTYKFQTAHRLAGYELHLYRSGHLNESADRWQHEMTQIGWEEAMRAWRVVQPTVFNKLYKKGRWFTTLRPNPFLKKGKGVWFIPHTLVVESASYYVGSYLDTIFRVMNILMIAGIISLICLFVQVFRAKGVSLSVP